MKRTIGPVLWLLLLLPCAAGGGELPQFDSDQAADRWLRAHSPSYLRMAEGVDGRGGYEIYATADYPGGVAYTRDGRGYIGLNDSLKGAHRVSVLVFEMTNLHQEDRHQEVAQRVRAGRLHDAVEFSLLREMIEYDGLHLHWLVLRELRQHLETVPPEMITWVSSTAKTFAEYQPPFAYDYIKAQMAGGHTEHFIRLFQVHRAEYVESSRRQRQDAAASPMASEEGGSEEGEGMRDEGRARRGVTRRELR